MSKLEIFLIGLLTFVFVGALTMGLVWNENRLQALTLITHGLVTARDVETDTDSDGDTATVWVVAYQYTPQGTTTPITQRQYVARSFYDSVNVEDSLPVRYLSTDPARATLNPYWQTDIKTFLLSVAVLFPLWAVFNAFALWFLQKRAPPTAPPPNRLFRWLGAGVYAFIGGMMMQDRVGWVQAIGVILFGYGGASLGATGLMFLIERYQRTPFAVNGRE